MKDRLAGLVLPDRTPVEKPPRKTVEAAAPGKKPIQKSSASKPRHTRRTSSLSGSDLAITGCGLALAFVCAIFPWYIFFNKEDFGTRPVVFEKRPVLALPADGEIVTPELVGKRIAMPLGAFPDLDMAATGTVAQDGPRSASEADQPFPGEKPNFDLVLVANGRAMIADDDGYWVVAPGSWLPDGSRVHSLERRNGGWVLVTSRGADVPIRK